MMAEGRAYPHRGVLLSLAEVGLIPTRVWLAGTCHRGRRWRLSLICPGPHLPLTYPCSRAGIRGDHGHRGGSDGDGGGDHVSAEPLQAVSTLLHRSAQPGPPEGRCSLLREYLSTLSLLAEPLLGKGGSMVFTLGCVGKHRTRQIGSGHRGGDGRR